MKFFLSLVILLILIFLIFQFPTKITSLATYNNVNISIAPEKNVKITAIILKPVIFYGLLQIGNETFFNVTDTQTIIAEITNVGSVLATIEDFFIKIYYFDGRVIEPIIQWNDTKVPFNLSVGLRSHLKFSFVPDKLGTYFVQVRAKYDGRVTEAWSSFLVTLPPIFKPVIQPPPIIEQPVPTIIQLRPPALQILAPDFVNLTKGENTTIAIIVKNVGERAAYNLKPFISLPYLLSYSISPLFISILEPNESAILSLSFFSSEKISPGTYSLFLEIVGNETSASKTIYINIIEKPIDICPDVYNKILSYQLILVIAKSRMYSYYLKGAEVANVNSTLQKAEYYLEKIKKLFEEKKCEEALLEVENVRTNIELALLQLESIILMPKIMPNYFLIGIIIVIIIFPIIFVILRKRRKKIKRPKLLKDIEKELQES